MKYITMKTHARHILNRDAIMYRGEPRVVTGVYISGKGREVELFGGERVEYAEDEPVTVKRLLAWDRAVPDEHMGKGLVAQMREDRLCSMTVYADETEAVVWVFNHEDGGHYHGDYFLYSSDGPGYIRKALAWMAERVSSVYWQ